MHFDSLRKKKLGSIDLHDRVRETCSLLSAAADDETFPKATAAAHDETFPKGNLDTR